MPLIKLKTGRYQYQLHRHVGGRRIRANKTLPAGWSKTQAQEFDRIETARIIAELTGVAPRAALIETAVAHYLRDVAPTLKSARTATGHLAALHGWYANKTFDDLPAIAREYTAEHRATLAPATIKQRLALLRAACRHAWRAHNMGDADPGARMAMPAVSNSRTRYLTHTEITTIVAAMPARTAPWALIAFYSGMRLGEIARAKIADGNFDLADTKNSTARTVPIHPALAPHVRVWPQRAAPHPDTVSHQFIAAAARCGLHDVTFHDLRHSAASALINAGVDLHTVGAILGHKSPISTKRYAHLTQASLAAAIGKIGRPKKCA